MLSVGSHPQWHFLFETTAYIAGYLTFRRERRRSGDMIDDSRRWTLLASASVGALLGSRLLGLAEHWHEALATLHDDGIGILLLAPGGKTIVGGLLGAWSAVELTKWRLRIRDRTGDVFVLPLCVGIAIGRLGCFVAGLADDTYGRATRAWWGVDFGDGVPRLPVQLVEIAFLCFLGLLLMRLPATSRGLRFRLFMLSYLLWRVGIDFFKPQPLIAGMNVIQWCALGGALVISVGMLQRRIRVRNRGQHAAMA